MCGSEDPQHSGIFWYARRAAAQGTGYACEGRIGIVKSAFRAVILAGGSGERFWPLSTPEMPKQFLSYFGGKSLIRQSVERLAGLVKPEDVFIITSAALVKRTRKELPAIPSKNIIGEPMRRDTGAAVALGVGVAGKSDGDVIGFFPADQLVAKPAAFRTVLKKAICLSTTATQNCDSSLIVTLGIKPTYPATGFGYIDPKSGTFVEKPDAAKARQYIKKGYLWNAGMFIARAGTFRAAFAEYAPALTVLAARPKGIKNIYPSLPRISFDYAVMEKHANVCVVPGDFGWDDVGNYLAFDTYFKHDVNGNVLEGEARAIDASDNIVVSRQNRIAVLGAKNLVVVSTPAGILIADKAHLGGMKKLFGR